MLLEPAGGCSYKEWGPAVVTRVGVGCVTRVGPAVVTRARAGCSY